MPFRKYPADVSLSGSSEATKEKSMPRRSFPVKRTTFFPFFSDFVGDDDSETASTVTTVDSTAVVIY